MAQAVFSPGHWCQPANSPLQYLILIECIDALPALYGQVLTTPQVIEELSHAQTPDTVRAWVQTLPAWLKIESLLKVDFLDTIDVGEASAWGSGASIDETKLRNT